MCGIAGFVDLQHRLSSGDAAATLERMCRVIAHRGPDDQGTMQTDEGANLGMRRLSYHRSRRWTSANLERRRFRQHCLQRRDLQLPRVATGTRSDEAITFKLIPTPK
jgi:hypothetical protein